MGQKPAERSVNTSHSEPKTQLRIDNLVGNVSVLQAGEQIVAGRASSFPIGTDDPGMHRQFLQFFSAEASWYVHNVGTQITPLLHSVSGTLSDQRLPPTKTAILAPGETSITFDTKSFRYEISVHVSGSVAVPDIGDSPQAQWTENRFEPTPEQRLLLRTLGGYILRSPDAPAHIVVPSTEGIAGELGWSTKKTQNKIQRLAKALDSIGLPEFRHTDEKYAWRIPLARWAAENWSTL